MKNPHKIIKNAIAARRVTRPKLSVPAIRKTNATKRHVRVPRGIERKLYKVRPKRLIHQTATKGAISNLAELKSIDRMKKKTGLNIAVKDEQKAKTRLLGNLVARKFPGKVEKALVGGTAMAGGAIGGGVALHRRKKKRTQESQLQEATIHFLEAMKMGTLIGNIGTLNPVKHIRKAGQKQQWKGVSTILRAKAAAHYAPRDAKKFRMYEKGAKLQYRTGKAMEKHAGKITAGAIATKGAAIGTGIAAHRYKNKKKNHK